MQSGITGYEYKVDSFQSSPGQKAGCNLKHRHEGPIPRMFQSSPGQKAGCNAI